MTDIKDELNGDGAGAGSGAGEPTKVEERINNLTGKLKSKSESEAKLLIENLSLKDPRYKRAPEFEKQILEKVQSGADVKDAIAAVLVSNDAFGAPADAGAAGAGAGAGNGAGNGGGNAGTDNTGTGSNAGKGAGGSAEIRADIKDRKDPKDMSQAEKLDALKEAEAAGEITLDR